MSYFDIIPEQPDISVPRHPDAQTPVEAMVESQINSKETEALIEKAIKETVLAQMPDTGEDVEGVEKRVDDIVSKIIKGADSLESLNLQDILSEVSTEMQALGPQFQEASQNVGKLAQRATEVSGQFGGLSDQLAHLGSQVIRENPQFAEISTGLQGLISQAGGLRGRVSDIGQQFGGLAGGFGELSQQARNVGGLASGFGDIRADIRGIGQQALNLETGIPSALGGFQDIRGGLQAAQGRLQGLATPELMALSRGELTPAEQSALQAQRDIVGMGRGRAESSIEQTAREQATARGLFSSRGAIEEEAAGIAGLDINEAQQLAAIEAQRANLSRSGLLSGTQLLSGLEGQLGGLFGQEAGVIGQQVAGLGTEAAFQQQGRAQGLQAFGMEGDLLNQQMTNQLNALVTSGQMSQQQANVLGQQLQSQSLESGLIGQQAGIFGQQANLQNMQEQQRLQQLGLSSNLIGQQGTLLQNQLGGLLSGAGLFGQQANILGQQGSFLGQQANLAQMPLNLATMRSNMLGQAGNLLTGQQAQAIQQQQFQQSLGQQQQQSQDAGFLGLLGTLSQIFAA